MAQKLRRRDATLNDARIFDAAIGQLAQVGPDRLAVKTLVSAAGLTTGPFYSRYLTIGELLADVWRQRLATVIRDLIGQVVEHRRTGSAAAGATVAATIETPGPELSAALALMVVAPRIDELAEVVPIDVAAWLDEFRLAGAGTHPDASVQLGLCGFALGAALRHRLPTDTTVPYGEFAALLPSVITVPADPGPTPTGAQAELVVDSDDQLRTSLLLAAQQVAARSGLVRATLTRIGRVANLPSTAVYGRYDSKTALFEDLTALAFSTILTPERVALVHADPASLGAGTAGWLRADAHVRRRLDLELLLGAVYDEEFRQAYCTLQRDYMTAAAAALLPAHRHPRRADLIQRTTSTVATGLALVSGVVPTIADLDWRPLVYGLFEGLDARYPS